MRLDRWFAVANMTIQHRLKVFDYYEPGNIFMLILASEVINDAFTRSKKRLN